MIRPGDFPKGAREVAIRVLETQRCCHREGKPAMIDTGRGPKDAASLHPGQKLRGRDGRPLARIYLMILVLAISLAWTASLVQAEDYPSGDDRDWIGVYPPNAPVGKEEFCRQQLKLDDGCGADGLGGWLGNTGGCSTVAAQFTEGPFVDDITDAGEVIEPGVTVFDAVRKFCEAFPLECAQAGGSRALDNPGRGVRHDFLLRCTGTCVTLCWDDQEQCPYDGYMSGNNPCEGNCSEGSACAWLSEHDRSGVQCWSCRNRQCDYRSATGCLNAGCPEQKCVEINYPTTDSFGGVVTEECWICDAQKGGPDEEVAPEPPGAPDPDRPDPPDPVPPPIPPSGPGGGNCPVNAPCSRPDGSSGRFNINCDCESADVTEGVPGELCSEIIVESQHQCPPECLNRCPQAF